MYSVSLECPHCGREGDFAITQFTHYHSKEPLKHGQMKNPVGGISYDTGERTKAHTSVACPSCNGPVLLIYEVSLELLANITNAIKDDRRIMTGEQPTLLKMYPEIKQPIVSEYYPGKVSKMFANAQRQLRDTEDDMMPVNVVFACRSVIEQALKALGVENLTLVKGIQKTQQEGLITEPLAAWAHHVRLKGNEAIHDLEANLQEAVELVEFVRFFLETVFVLPKRIEDKRAG